MPVKALDAAYGKKRPGWERYVTDSVEYLVFREKSKLKAVQVAVDQFIEKQTEDNVKRAMAEERRMMRLQGIPPPPPPADPPKKQER